MDAKNNVSQNKVQTASVDELCCLVASANWIKLH